MPKFEYQNKFHDDKRLQCDCGSWNWKIEMQRHLTSQNFVCADCGFTVSSNVAEDTIRKEHENANT